LRAQGHLLSPALGIRQPVIIVDQPDEVFALALQAGAVPCGPCHGR
jgi:hypothetical protein